MKKPAIILGCLDNLNNIWFFPFTAKIERIILNGKIQEGETIQLDDKEEYHVYS